MENAERERNDELISPSVKARASSNRVKSQRPLRRRPSGGEKRNRDAGNMGAWVLVCERKSVILESYPIYTRPGTDLSSKKCGFSCSAFFCWPLPPFFMGFGPVSSSGRSGRSADRDRKSVV